jgi:hypothetical protein
MFKYYALTVITVFLFIGLYVNLRADRIPDESHQQVRARTAADASFLLRQAGYPITIYYDESGRLRMIVNTKRGEKQCKN